MENKIQVFNNARFGEIRTLEENGKPLFCGSDVAKALGYADPKKAVIQHCKEDGVAICPLTDNLGRTQQAKFITEGNVYRLIVHSKLPQAERFERWLFDEVVPTLCKTGGYVANLEQFVSSYLPDLPGEYQDALRRVLYSFKCQDKEIDELKGRVAELESENEKLAELTAEVGRRTAVKAEKKLICKLVKKYSGYTCQGVIAFGWTEFKKELIYRYGIDVNRRVTNYLNESGKKTKPATLDMLADSELDYAMSVITEMCTKAGIDIAEAVDEYRRAV